MACLTSVQKFFSLLNEQKQTSVLNESVECVFFCSAECVFFVLKLVCFSSDSSKRVFVTDCFVVTPVFMSMRI